MSETPFFGYAGQVWANVYAAVAYLTDQIENNSDVITLYTLTQAAFNSIANGITAIDANQYVTSWTTEKYNLQNIQALPLNLDPTSAQYFTDRQGAINAALTSLSPLVPQPPFGQPSVMLPGGNPTIPFFDMVSWYGAFNFEQPPPGLNSINFLADALQVATSFQNVANAIQSLQGSSLTQLYDCALRQGLCANLTYTILNSFTSGPLSFVETGSSPWSSAFSSGFGPLTNLSQPWNQLVSVPAVIFDADVLANAMYLLSNQQSMVIRYVMISMLQQLATFLLILRNPVQSNISLATVYQNDTLMDVAARSLNDFEQWTTIASLNNLQPPYIATATGTNVAAPGSQLLLPVQGGATVVSGIPAPSYTNNFLGIDYYLGPINAPMNPWTGDIGTIAGYQNLAISLGRRLQTTLGSLIYHSTYGSRIPPEVGTVQTSTEAARISAFGTSAILADPRVAAVLQATAALVNNGQTNFQGVVQPKGPGSQNVSLNEVIGAVP